MYPSSPRGTVFTTKQPQCKRKSSQAKLVSFLSRATGTRTPNSGARNRCVANYTIALCSWNGGSIYLLPRRVKPNPAFFAKNRKKNPSKCRTVRAIRLNLRVTPFYLRAILNIIHQYTRLKTTSPNLRVALFYLRVHFKAYVLLGSVVPPELSTTSFCIRILRRFTTV